MKLKEPQIIVFLIYCEMGIAGTVWLLLTDPPRRRGRRVGSIWKCRLFLLGKSNDDFVPSAAEQGRLSRIGMGNFVLPFLFLLLSFDFFS